MFSIVTLDMSMLLTLAKAAIAQNVEPAGGTPSFLPSSCWGSLMPRLLRARTGVRGSS